MTSLQNGNYNSRSMNGLTTIYANDVNCDVINTIDANVSNKLKVGVEAEMDGTLSVAGITTAAQINGTGLNISGNADVLGSLDVSGNVDISGNLTVVGITDTTTLQADTLTVSGNADVLGSLDVSGNVDISGNLNVVGNYTSATGDIVLTNGTVSASSMTATNFFGTATNAGNVLITSDNTNASYYIPFVKTSGTGNKQLFIDDTTTPIIINPFTGAFNFANAMKVNTNFAGNLYNISIGLGAGENNQSGAGAVAIGFRAGLQNQGANAFAFGTQSGEINQGANSFALGVYAGYDNQGTNCVGIGQKAGFITQANNAVSVGALAGSENQGSAAVAIGRSAAEKNQGAFAVAIGYLAGFNNQPASSISLNASGVQLNPNASGLFVRPIRGVDLKIGIGNLFYNTTTFELQYSTTNSKITYNATTDLTTIDSSLNVLGTLATFPNASMTIATATPATGCKLTVNGKTQTIDLDVSGVLAIPTYPNVKTTLDSFSSTTTNTTGITYTAGTDTTTIDNNLEIGNNKVFTLQDGTTQETAYNERELNDCDFHSFFSGRTILASTFNMGDAYPTSRSIAQNVWYFNAMRMVKNQAYTGVGIFTTTSGSFEVAVYQKGSGGSRLALSNATTTTANVITYIPFQNVYTATATDIVYVVFKTSSASQFAICSQTNIAYLNLTNALGTTGLLDRRAQYSNLVGAFPATIPGTLPVSVDDTNTRLAYLVLYN